MKKNICFAYITPFHPDRGGIGRVTHTLTLELQKRGYNVFYLIYPCAITIRHEYNYPTPLEYLPSGELLSDENVEYYFKYLRKNNIDIVINQSGNFSDSRLWCRAREIGVKVISVLHSQPWVSYKHLWQTDIIPLKSTGLKEQLKRIARIVLYPKIKKRIREDRIRQFKFLLLNTDRVVLLSENYFPELSEIVPGYEHLYEAIPNANSYESSDLVEIKKEKIILFVGLFNSPKNEHLVLKLWQRVYRDYPDWKLVMVGDGPKPRVVRLKHIAQKMERVEFTGLVPAKDYQRKASILLMTSGYEGWPMVLTEAMQCGTIPMAFNSFASASTIINNGIDGFLIRPFSLKEYEKKLRKLMDDGETRNTMSINAGNSVKRFDVSEIVDRWEKLFSTL